MSTINEKKLATLFFGAAAIGAAAGFAGALFMVGALGQRRRQRREQELYERQRAEEPQTEDRVQRRAPAISMPEDRTEPSEDRKDAEDESVEEIAPAASVATPAAAAAPAEPASEASAVQKSE